MKNMKIEAEKGFRRTLFEPELVDPNMEINFDNDSEEVSSQLHLMSTLSLPQKGKQFKSYYTCRKGVWGNPRRRLDDASLQLESFLFSLNGAFRPCPLESARLKTWTGTIDKGATYMLLILMELLARCPQKRVGWSLFSHQQATKVTVEQSYSYISYS